MIALVLGVWANVFAPNTLPAHGGQTCVVSGTGWGELDGSEVYVYEISGEAYCPDP